MSREYWRRKGLNRNKIGDGGDDGEGVGLTKQWLGELCANLLYSLENSLEKKHLLWQC